MKTIASIALAAALLESGCASGQTFSDVVGPMRISGQLQENILSPQDKTLSLHVTDASTGYPIDATSVQIKTGNSRVVSANRRQLGSYEAHISGADKFEVYVVAKGQAAVIALQRQ